MKKKLLLSFMVVSLMLLSAGVGAFAATQIKLVVNGTVSNAQTKVIAGVTYVPLRAAAELLGAEVKYDAATSTVSITSEGGSTTGTTTPPASAAKSFNVDVTIENGPVVLKISKVTFDPAYKQYSFESESHKAIILDVRAENTSADKVEWYVDQSKLVLNTKEQIEDSLLGDARISGEFNGKVVKNGKIVFPVKDSQFDDITSMRILTPFILDTNFERIAEDKEADIILK